MFESADSLHLAMAGLMYLINDLHDQVGRDELREERRIRNEWTNADTDGNGQLDRKEI